MSTTSGERRQSDVTWLSIAKVLKNEAWEGRWSPLEERNVGPLAGVTADAIIKGYERLGLRLVAVEIDATAPLPDQTQGRDERRSRAIPAFKVAAWVPVSRQVLADFARSWQERAVILRSPDPSPFPRMSIWKGPR